VASSCSRSPGVASPGCGACAFPDLTIGARGAAEGDWPDRDTERIILAAARVGQHAFALNVLTNCGRRCVFCGVNPSPGMASGMLLAGHIKPWKDSSASERLEPMNGLAAIPAKRMVS
jgi:hypothetical protein